MGFFGFLQMSTLDVRYAGIGSINTMPQTQNNKYKICTQKNQVVNIHNYISSFPPSHHLLLIIETSRT